MEATNTLESTERTTEETVSKHTHKHCWLEKHFWGRGLKKLGALGVVIFVLHILFHVVEILIIPAILVWLGINS